MGIDYHSIQSNSASTVAAPLNDIHSGGGGCGDCYYPKSRAKPNRRIYRSSRKKFTFFYDQHLPFLHQHQINTRGKKGRRREKNNNIKTMTHHRMGFTPSSSTSSSSSSTTKPSAITTKKPSQRACLGGMVITPCEKCTIRTYVSLYPSLYPIPFNIIFILTLFRFFPLPSSISKIVSHTYVPNEKQKLN